MNDINDFYIDLVARQNSAMGVGTPAIGSSIIPPQYNPLLDQASYRTIAHKETPSEQRARYRLQISDPRVLAVYDLLIASDGRRYDDIAKDVVKTLDALAMAELHELPVAVAA